MTLFLALSGICSLLTALIYTTYLATQTSAIEGPARQSQDYIPIVYTAVASMFLYYIFLFYQSATSFYEFQKARIKYYENKKESEKPRMEKIKYGSDNFNVLVGNRTVANYSEQILPFLVGLFLCATFVDVARACRLGWAWIFFRTYYPFVYRTGVPWLFLSTLPAYACVWTMLGATVLGIS